MCFIERSLLSLKTCSRIAWALLGIFIVLGSMGDWAPDRPGIWAPMLIVRRDVVENVLLYVPFGVFGVLALRGTYPRHWARLVARVVGIAILFSASNEALQLYTSDRVASVTDVVSAAIGSSIGGVGVSLLLPRSRSARSRP